MTKTEIIEFCKQNLVALDDEIALLLRAIDQKISIIIKGESGTGKTELAKTIASALNRP
ncbi:MAG: AAA family ATPase, partial [Candidatus Heimdallarchaeota archaeon]|nr:AAA family ATPase [Candidatus Heimdallarchaeota archaeon]